MLPIFPSRECVAKAFGRQLPCPHIPFLPQSRVRGHGVPPVESAWPWCSMVFPVAMVFPSRECVAMVFPHLALCEESQSGIHGPVFRAEADRRRITSVESRGSRPPRTSCLLR